MQKLIQTPIGALQLDYDKNNKLVSCVFTHEKATSTNEHFDNYFNKRAQIIPIDFDYESLGGTPFEQSVWRAISDIPYGETRTYSEIAAAIGKPKSCRAVANACGTNPLAIVIPCHRVVGKGNDSGYHWGLDKKRYLLNLEKS